MIEIIYNHPKRKSVRRKLRKTSTTEETVIWKRLRNNSIGFKFRRQYGVSGYIVDFYCPERRLGVEIDGAQHLANKEYDNLRTKTLNDLDITVLRFWNSEVKDDLEKVIKKIKSALL